MQYSDVSEWGDIMHVSTVLSMIVGLSSTRMMNLRVLYHIPRRTAKKVAPRVAPGKNGVPRCMMQKAPAIVPVGSQARNDGIPRFCTWSVPRRMMLVGHRDLLPGGKFNRHFDSDFNGDVNSHHASQRDPTPRPQELQQTPI